MGPIVIYSCTVGFCIMGISIDAWRQRIGLHNGATSVGLQSCHILSSLPTGLSSAIHLFLVICMLLVLGNVELNPGPQPPVSLKACSSCKSQFKTAQQHIEHQRLHANNFNFSFECPYSLCLSTFKQFKSLNAHVSNHTVRRDQVVGNSVSFKCPYCDGKVSTNMEYCKHLKEHLNNGLSVQCPFHFANCSRTELFSSPDVFKVHLSQCHGGWRKDLSTTALEILGTQDEIFMQQGGGDEVVHEDVSLHGDTDAFHNHSDDDDDTGSESGSEHSCGVGGFDHSDIVQYFGNFYAMLEGAFLVPESTVDVIARSLSFISAALQDKLRADLSRSLQSVGLPEETRERVIEAALTMDPFYNIHHLNAPDECFLTGERRRTYYKNVFKYQPVIQMNLRKNPYDASHYLHYVDLRTTVSILIQDPSVEKIIDASFLVQDSDDSILKDYTDGTVFKTSNTPHKRIDLMLFMDSCSYSDGLKSAKNKYKLHGMYITLGNFKPYMRSFLKAIRLVSFVNNDSLKSQRMYSKVFDRILKNLKELEDNGISYKNEIIPVRLQFIQGDNLGQATLSGMVESPTAHYFCRFCLITKAEFKEDAAQDQPVFRKADMRTPQSFEEHLRTKIETNAENVCGVKRDSPFHQLTHFKVCEPRLAPCIAHDLFIDGVAENDLTAMINYFIRKGWFSREELKMRIKGFKYLGNDARNKPSTECSEAKLGGHAIQNWNLIRLLPFIIGHKVHVNNKVWKLYLLLKSIVERVCSPALAKIQVEEMRVLIDKYMMKRKRLGTKYKPKTHIFSHYPDLYLLLGPLIHLWTMAFEHRHQYFKRVARICRNFINLGSLLASKFQLLQAYQNMGPLFPDRPIYSNSSPLQLEEYEGNLKDVITSCQLSQNAVVVPRMSLNEIKYKNEQWLLLEKNSEDIVLVGQIELLIYDTCAGTCTAILNKYECGFWKEFGLYYVTDTEPKLCAASLLDLENPCPHAVYEFQNMLCFSLKHEFLKKRVRIMVLI